MLPRRGLSLNPFNRAKQLQKLDRQGVKVPKVPAAKGINESLNLYLIYHDIHIFPVTKRIVPTNLVSDLGTADRFPPKMSPFYEMIVESMEDTRILHESAGLTVDGKPIQDRNTPVA